MVTKVVSRIDALGRIALPANIRRALQLKDNQVVEIRTVGSGRHRRLLVSVRPGR